MATPAIRGEVFDVIVLGAGISGIDAAYHLKKMCPSHTFTVLERRASFGGTWDLFRYPGIRSDSSMLTFGYRHKPWLLSKPIAEGKDILAYLADAIDEACLMGHFRFGHHVISASWSSSEAMWHLMCENGVQFKCRFVFSCMGYYDYDRAHLPDFQGADIFTAAGGKIVHPQWWPTDMDYGGKRVVVIGSGATAITLVPSMARNAAHVAMLQRSPGFIINLVNDDPVVLNAVQDGSPVLEAYQRARELQVASTVSMHEQLRKVKPEVNKQMYIDLMRACISREDMSDEDFERHFTPKYNPWEQRVCCSPDGDFFEALRSNKASIHTDHIDHLDAKGLVLRSGARLDADIIVTATGLHLHENSPMASMAVTVDGVPYVARDHYSYKGCMLSGIPNFACSIGYFNASWTLKADLTCTYVCRLLQHMRSYGFKVCCPRIPASQMGLGSAMDHLSSGYIVRSKHLQPKVGTEKPWTHLSSFFEDRQLLEQEPIDDGHLEFVVRSRL